MKEPKKRSKQPPSKTNVEIETARLKYRFRAIVVIALSIPLTVVSFWFPLQPSKSIVESVSGESTNIGLSASLSIGIAMSLVGAAGLYKMFAQRQELGRLRERIKGYERAEIEERVKNNDKKDR